LKGKPSIHLVVGKAVHETIARICRTNTATGRDDETKAALMEIFRDVWQTQKEEIEKLKIEDDRLSQYYDECKIMLLSWLKRHQGSGHKRPESEVKLFSKRHSVMGIIDAIIKHNGKTMVLDYKTGANTEITDDIKVQLAIYALLYRENFGAIPDILAIDYLKSGTVKRFGTSQALIDYGARLCEAIHRKTASMDERDYPCTCGGWCERDFENGRGQNHA